VTAIDFYREGYTIANRKRLLVIVQHFGSVVADLDDRSNDLVSSHVRKDRLPTKFRRLAFVDMAIGATDPGHIDF
jgi:hypothetical protein